MDKGVFTAPLPTDLRGPCPIVNALANHGYIPRDGRNVSSSEMKIALGELGISSTITTVLTYASYLEHQAPDTSAVLWNFLGNPLAYFLRGLGMRDLHQEDSSGNKCLNLDQLSRHGAVEHDVSLTRRDYAQGDNHSPQEDLIAELIAASSNGRGVTTADFAALRRKRYEQQRRDNPELVFGSAQNGLACGEVAFIQKVFGEHEELSVEYLKALFAEERLPIAEGWKKRVWWPLGFVELTFQSKAVSSAVASLKDGCF